MKNHALGYKTEQNTRSALAMVSLPFSLGNPATFAFNRNSSSALCSPHSPVFASIQNTRIHTSPLQSFDGATQRLIFVPRTMTQGMHRRQSEHTQRRCWAVYSIINTCWREQVFRQQGKRGTYAERSNIKERTALCESVVAGAQVISHHYAITDHEQKQKKKKIKHIRRNMYTIGEA
ncbi:hypothetical protein M752DRAFT_168350 [Aspergillus phoenicis ATCC 13157]|uniref:Uncharacterized protein n=1 Tax=Aspergillus phoenicis ATCC 13157 TaxID=1353007 RepID=A0A370PLR8_ASPPH|nr:hypothetical protein M752DRAFT_168350 [Aspergillus phoenicis ATCC 13157]